jgi:two-component system NtrC family response regulator
VNDPVCLVGAAVSLHTLLGDVDAAACSDANVLITGERGAGKNTVAQLIHLQSHRSRGPLVTVDCATEVHPEHFERLDMARGGTILIDHIEELSPEMQAHLMLFLETGRRLLDVRVIAAADRDLLDGIAAGEFREDLYYRLNVIHLMIPPGAALDQNPIATTTAF